LTPNDTYITQHENVYQMVWLKSGSVTESLTRLSEKLKANYCLFLGQDEMFGLTSNEPYELHYSQFTDEFYCMTDTDRIFLERCSFFNNTEVLNLLNLESQYVEFVNTYLGHLKNLREKEFNEVNTLMAHNTIQRILLFALSLNIEKLEEFNTKRLSPQMRTILSKFNQLIKI